MVEQILNYLQNLVFSEIGDHIRPGSCKRLLDVSFVIFEKIAFVFENIANFYINVYQEMVDNELGLLNNYKIQTILIIGSGSIPATPILVAEKTNATIMCIDIDNHAIKKSKTLIERLNLSDRITVERGDGIHFPLDEFDAIFILYGLKSQSDMLDSLSKRLPENLPVILRVVPSDGQALIDNQLFDLSTLFEIKDSVRSHSWGLLDSHLLEKKKKMMF